jgi:hypothetical protein
MPKAPVQHLRQVAKSLRYWPNLNSQPLALDLKPKHAPKTCLGDISIKAAGHELQHYDSIIH